MADQTPPPQDEAARHDDARLRARIAALQCATDEVCAGDLPATDQDRRLVQERKLARAEVMEEWLLRPVDPPPQIQVTMTSHKTGAVLGQAVIDVLAGRPRPGSRRDYGQVG